MLRGVKEDISDGVVMFGGWDTIIVGAGVGGLTAAARLVKAGQRVLVLEKSPHAGG